MPVIIPGCKLQALMEKPGRAIGLTRVIKLEVYDEYPEGSEKLDQIRKKRSQSIRYIQHQDRQEQRIGRICELLRLSPIEAEELVALILEWSVSARWLSGKVAHLKKRIK